jgi:uncharacterized membrane protein
MVFKKPETAVIPNWHESHSETLSLGDRIADKVAAFIGSWEFIILQSFILWVWALGNIYALFHFDPYPFIAMNLFMSAEAAFATPLLLMSQNRQAERDRHQAEADYHVNQEAKKDIESLQEYLTYLETQRLGAIRADVAAILSIQNEALAVKKSTPARKKPKTSRK